MSKTVQHSFLERFCDECGRVNDPDARSCVGCQHALVSAGDILTIPPIAPITPAPPTVLEVTPGPLFAQEKKSTLPSEECDFRPGSMFAGRYQIKEEIGQGGFSRVYRAVDRSEFRQVAIKRIQLSQLTPRQMIDATETFNREVATLPRFKSLPGIPAYYTHLTDAENWYLITQYIEGQTLEEYLQQAPGGCLTEKETIELGIDIAILMNTLHTHEPPIIFRDLKPANVMLITPPKHQPSGELLLTIEYTASNKLLPHPAWQRPRDLDLMRFRLLSAEENHFYP